MFPLGGTCLTQATFRALFARERNGGTSGRPNRSWSDCMSPLTDVTTSSSTSTITATFPCAAQLRSFTGRAGQSGSDNYRSRGGKSGNESMMMNP